MTRLTFVGDIALDKPLLKAAKARGNGQFDFSDVFHTDHVFAKSDLVIGNLETCFGGGNRFNTKPYHYNSPDAFCKAIRDAGIGLVGTANNHCMDEGNAGVLRTLQQLDANGIEHTGTFAPGVSERYLIKEINGIKIAFFSLTYSVNQHLEAVECNDLFQYVNLTGFTGRMMSRGKRYLAYCVKPLIAQKIKKLTKKSTISAHTDSFRVQQINPAWMCQIEEALRRAKSESDYLIVLLHSGGQFNIEPGEYSKFMMERLCELGADVVIGNHPHTVQRIENRDGRIVAYSLGGYCMSVSGEYLVHDCLPEYSLALHIDLSENRSIKCEVTVLKGTEDRQGYLTVREAEVSDEGARMILDRCGMK
ncbi:CapA family protein [Paenibacillus sp.]